MFVWVCPGSESLTVKWCVGKQKLLRCSWIPLCICLKLLYELMKMNMRHLQHSSLSSFIFYTKGTSAKRIFDSKTMPLNSCSVCMSVCIWFRCPTSHLPRSVSLLAINLAKEYRSESEVPLRLKERGWFVCERACLHCQISSCCIRHKRTPTGVCPWKSDFILSVSHGHLVHTGGFGMVRTERGRMGWKSGVSPLFCTFEIYSCLLQVIRSP